MSDHPPPADLPPTDPPFPKEARVSIWEGLAIIAFTFLCPILAFILGAYLFVTARPQRGGRLMAYAFLWLLLESLFHKYSLHWWSDGPGCVRLF